MEIMDGRRNSVVQSVGDNIASNLCRMNSKVTTQPHNETHCGLINMCTTHWTPLHLSGDILSKINTFRIFLINFQSESEQQASI